MRHIWLVVAVACASASACAPAATAPRAVARPETPAPASAPAAESIATEPVVSVQGESIWMHGSRLDDAQLSTSLGRGRGARDLLVVQLSADASDGALAALLTAAAAAGFAEARLQLASEALTVALTSGTSKPRVVAWVHDGRLVGYDLEEPAIEKGVLGPLQLGDERATTELRHQLAAICAGRPCRAELDVIAGSPGLIWPVLRSWLKMAEGLPTLSFHVVAVAPQVAPVSTAGSPRVRYGATTVSGRLPPIVIQRIVRKNFEKFRRCYEAGLGRNAELTGRVMARFVIRRDGTVSNVTDAGSDIADVEVQRCVLEGMATLEFPPPLNGIVTVVYPVLFVPG